MSNETMKDGERAAFEAWWISESHRTKYPKDHPVYLAGLEAWQARATSPQSSEKGTSLINELFERQQAGFERCFETLGITDDRERSWSSLVLAINKARAAAPQAPLAPDVRSALKACAMTYEINGFATTAAGIRALLNQGT